MIVREIKTNTKEVLESFDWFNDYKDTRNWCKYCFPEIIPQLDDGYNKWLNKTINSYK